MAHRRLAHERPDHELAFSVLVITMRVLAITLPLLALAVLAAIFGGSGDPGTADLVFMGSLVGRGSGVAERSRSDPMREDRSRSQGRVGRVIASPGRRRQPT